MIDFLLEIIINCYVFLIESYIVGLIVVWWGEGGWEINLLCFFVY